MLINVKQHIIVVVLIFVKVQFLYCSSSQLLQGANEIIIWHSAYHLTSYHRLIITNFVLHSWKLSHKVDSELSGS